MAELQMIQFIKQNWESLPGWVVLSIMGITWARKMGFLKFKKFHVDIDAGSDEPETKQKSMDDTCRMLAENQKEIVKLMGELTGSVKVIEQSVAENTRTLVDMEKNNVEVRRGILDKFKDLGRFFEKIDNKLSGIGKDVLVIKTLEGVKDHG